MVETSISPLYMLLEKIRSNDVQDGHRPILRGASGGHPTSVVADKLCQVEIVLISATFNNGGSACSHEIAHKIRNQFITLITKEKKYILVKSFRTSQEQYLIAIQVRTQTEMNARAKEIASVESKSKINSTYLYSIGIVRNISFHTGVWFHLSCVGDLTWTAACFQTPATVAVVVIALAWAGVHHLRSTMVS